MPTSSEPSAETGKETPANAPQVLKRAPTLYAIIIFKLLKGSLLVALAFIFYTMSDNDLPTQYQSALHSLGLNPDRRFWSELAVKVGNLTEREVVRVAIGTFIYSLFSLVEGVGLMFRVGWAGWLAIGESAFFIPIEVLELMRHFTRPVFIILILNIAMLWYLFQNRERLFRHHHPRH
ncbi:MAG: hypothetical protein JWR19_3242 [Pedosphaera sp.]|nr:hypothetical protein [Pedosphaera sp.]